MATSPSYTIFVPARMRWDYDNKCAVEVSPARQMRVAVEIDIKRIATQLGRKAACSKSGKSKALAGAIVVKVLSNGGISS